MMVVAVMIVEQLSNIYYVHHRLKVLQASSHFIRQQMSVDGLCGYQALMGTQDRRLILTTNQ